MGCEWQPQSFRHQCSWSRPCRQGYRRGSRPWSCPGGTSQRQRRQRSCQMLAGKRWWCTRRSAMLVSVGSIVSKNGELDRAQRLVLSAQIDRMNGKELYKHTLVVTFCCFPPLVVFYIARIYISLLYHATTIQGEPTAKQLISYHPLFFPPRFPSSFCHCSLLFFLLLLAEYRCVWWVFFNVQLLVPFWWICERSQRSRILRQRGVWCMVCRKSCFCCAKLNVQSKNLRSSMCCQDFALGCKVELGFVLDIMSREAQDCEWSVGMSLPFLINLKWFW